MIKDVINSVKKDKFTTVVIDNAANIKKARKIIHEEFSSIQNM